MANAKRKTLSAYRRRLKRKGIVRLEGHVRRGDALLLRGVVRALGDPDREAEARALLRERFAPASRRASTPCSQPRRLRLSISHASAIGRDIAL